MHFKGQSGTEAREGEHGSQIAKCLTACVRQSDLGRYSRLVSALWLFRSLNAQIENALVELRPAIFSRKPAIINNYLMLYIRSIANKEILYMVGVHTVRIKDQRIVLSPTAIQDAIRIHVGNIVVPVFRRSLAFMDYRDVDELEIASILTIPIGD